MKEEEILMFADLIDSLAKQNPNYGIDLFFKTPDTTKKEAFEKGKEIESCSSEYCYKLREDSILKRHYSVKQAETWNDEENLFKLNEIRGKWYIHD